jgi:hypothetical protein
MKPVLMNRHHPNRPNFALRHPNPDFIQHRYVEACTLRHLQIHIYMC